MSVEEHYGAILSRFAKAGALLVASAGALVLLGWIFDIVALKSLVPGLASMKVNTALAFMAAGAALWSINSSALRRQSLLTRILPCIVLALGVLSLGECLFDVDLGIDQLLLSDPEISPHPGRMAPTTALNFVFVGTALLALTGRQSRVVASAQWLVVPPIFISALAIVGYAYGVSALYQVKPFASMALHTALASLVLALGILTSDQRLGLPAIAISDTAGGVLLRRLLPTVPLTLFGLGWARLEGERAGLYGFEFGLALMVLISTTVCVIAISWTACTLRNIDAIRKRGETELRDLNATLEQRVQDRTRDLTQQHAALERQDAELRARTAQLDAALDNMVEGIAMFDAEHRIVLANRRYAEMYGLRLDQIKPGTTFEQVVQHRIDSGQLRGRTASDVVATVLARVSNGKDASFTYVMDDGRHITLSAQPMPEGGTVTTHRDVTEQRRSDAKIVHMAFHDSLTGLPNRTRLTDRLEHALTRVKRGDIVVAHLLDLDHFKNINDTLGHAAGDKLLKVVAARLEDLVRETDTIARMGGDEFAIIQVAISGPADAAALANRIIEVLGAPYDLDGHQVCVGASVGVAVASANTASADELMRNADLALYSAKAEGRGTYCFFEPEMDAQLQEQRSLESDLRKALGAGELELHYQPIVSVAASEILGFEALMRWRHPVKGLILPGSFIGLAEANGFIVRLGEWAIRQACAVAAKWPTDITVSVNLSPVQFRSSGLVQTVVDALSASRLEPERLELEITEDLLLQDSEQTLNILFQLRSLGVCIAMDDFGTGYSSLSYLQSFPLDRIKIDRSFTSNIHSAQSLSIVQAVTALAKALDMQTTAEGVETVEQRDAIAATGCTAMQGFLFGKPLNAHEVEELLKSGRHKREHNPQRPFLSVAS